MARLFGTDGVRGIANEKLDCALAYRLGQAAAFVLMGGGHRPQILIGKDTRVSCDMLEAALTAGICSAGAEAVSAGVLPTSAVAFLTRSLGTDAGFVISASHNAAPYNGIKIFGAGGYKLPDAVEDKIEALITGEASMPPLPTGGGIGRRSELPGALKLYTDYIKNTASAPLTGLKVVLDCANGAAFEAAPKVFSDLGAEVIVINAEPDGLNINDGCGSTCPEGLCAAVLEHGADAGLAFDGDADRLIAADETGCLLDGDVIMAICADHMKSTGELDGNTVVATVMSNFGFKKGLAAIGVNIVETQVGDRYVLEAMRAGGYALGGEQSGHIIFLKHNSTGDGILTGVKLLSVAVGTGKRLSDLKQIMTVYPQVLEKAHVSEEGKHTYADNPRIRAAIEALDVKMSSSGRLLVRASGTEPLVRVMLEGTDLEEMRRDAQALAKLIEEELA